MTAEAENTFALEPETIRWARWWILGWTVLAALCSPTLIDGMIRVTDVAPGSCLFGLVVLWTMPVASAAAVYGPTLVDRLLSRANLETRQTISVAIVIASVASAVFLVLPAFGFVALLTIQLALSGF